ncbi:MAG: GMC family oxidoreductase [SAR324 cluster bacterium]|nr:GMC family oxidoreductase [SAR324 cluster bacterium]
MIIDLSEEFSSKQIEADICIVGSGAAGMALANEFKDYKGRVVMLESGEMNYNEKIQGLHKGVFSYHGLGRRVKSEKILDRDRLRAYGGTSKLWGGMCATFDEIDFEKRSWVPYSGWPFSREHLLPFYDRASKFLKIPPTKPIIDPARPPFTINDDGDLITKMFYSIHSRDLGGVMLKTIKESQNISLYLNATVKNIDLNSETGRVDSLTVLRNNLQTPPLLVKAKKYILATGAIENPRILLSSNDINKNGVGNDKDVVGRFFQGHGFTKNPTMAIMFTGNKNMEVFNYHRRSEHAHGFGMLGVSAKIQKKYQTLNCYIGAKGIMLNHKNGPLLGDIQSEMNLLGEDLNHPLAKSTWAPALSRSLFEQEPNPANRVILSKKRDWLGTPRCKVDYKVSELQKETLVGTMKAVGQMLGQEFQGKVRIDQNGKSIFRSLDDGGAKHHIGTTRMNDDPTLGVVNSDCQAHSVANLFIAGASVFPTSSGTNPTYTIVAMSIRLADHIKKLMGSV